MLAQVRVSQVEVLVMTSALYRKYRPQTFAEVVGQDQVTQTLQHEIIQDKLTHAYLFCGMRGVGKTTVARLLAKAINCEQRSAKESEPCNRCLSCQAMSRGRSLDLIEIDAASNRRIDDVREIREHIPYGPTLAKYKVVIIDEVHMLTTEAFNALLKTLEEPPAHVLFVLCTTEVHKLPETIVSRCQRFDFRRLNSAVLLARLRQISEQEKVKVDEAVLKQVVELADGSGRDAEGYLGKLVSLGEKVITPAQAALVLPHADLAQAFDFSRDLVVGDARAAVELVNSFLEQGGDIAYFYRQVLDLMRKMLLVKLGGKLTAEATTDLVPEFHDQLVSLAGNLTQARLNKMLARWLEVEGSWRLSDVWQLPLELAAVEIALTSSAAGLGVGAETKPEINPGLDKKTDSVKKGVEQGLDLRQILDGWPKLVASLREYNHSLSFILSVARPLKLEGETLTVGFSYQLHLERVADPKVKSVIEQAIAKEFGVKVHVRGVADDVKAGGDLLTNVLTTFGGSVVD